MNWGSLSTSFKMPHLPVDRIICRNVTLGIMFFKWVEVRVIKGTIQSSIYTKITCKYTINCFVFLFHWPSKVRGDAEELQTFHNIPHLHQWDLSILVAVMRLLSEPFTWKLLNSSLKKQTKKTSFFSFLRFSVKCACHKCIL